MAGEIALRLLGVEVVTQSGEAPYVRVLTESSGQGTHDRLGGQHVAAQVLVGHARLHLGEHGGAVGRHPARPFSI